MNTSKLGCLSPFAMLSALLAIFALLIVEILNGNAMFSPGRSTPPMPISAMTAANAMRPSGAART